MNKDALLATIIGFGVGLVLTGVVFMGPAIINNFPKIHIPGINLAQYLPKVKPSKLIPTPMAKRETDLSIDSPLDQSIEPKNEVLISGHTYNGAIVVLEGENIENVVRANNQGAYAGTVTLQEGKNTIYVTSYSSGKTKKQSMTVYYTPEEF